MSKLKQNNVVNKLTKHPIEFKSLSFTSCTEQYQNIINPNKNKESIFNCIISLSGQKTETGKIRIPVKYSRKHHGELKDYYKKPNSKGKRQISYKICFQENKIRIILSKPTYVNESKYKKHYYGIDVNLKHNLFCDRYGDTIDYDRGLFNDYIKFLKSLDEKKSRKHKNEKLSNKDSVKFSKWKVRINDMLKRQCNLLVKQGKAKGKDHLVLEDLGSFAKSFSKNDEFEGFKYSRLVRLLNLSNIKNIVKSIANKNKIQVTFIQPYYTSKGCDACGCIDDLNRIMQEVFKCISCGRVSNADTHSAGMIEDRLVLDVLRRLLLIEKDGMYIPRRLTKSKIKEILVECYDTNNSSLKEELIKLY